MDPDYFEQEIKRFILPNIKNLQISNGQLEAITDKILFDFQESLINEYWKNKGAEILEKSILALKQSKTVGEFHSALEKIK